MDPDQRCSAAKALESHYLAPYHDPNDEPVSTEEFDWSLSERNLSVDVWRTIIYTEVLGYHNTAGGSTRLTPQVDGVDSTP